MGVRDKLKNLGGQVFSRGVDLVAKRLYGGSERSWSQEERSSGVILSGSSKNAGAEAESLARAAGYEVKESSDPSSDITRPRAGRTFGARFDHYPILAPGGPLPAKGSEAVWDLTAALRPHLVGALQGYKERILLAFTGLASPDSDRLEDQLLELHPILEPQCCVLFLRVGHVEEERLYRRVRIGELVLTLPAVPILLNLHLDADGTLSYRSLALRALDVNAPRFGIVALIGGQTHIPAGEDGVMELQVGKTRRRSSAAEGFKKDFSARVDLTAAEESSG